MYIYHLSLSKFYQDFKIIQSTLFPFWMFSGFLSTMGWGVNVCIHATVNMWRSDDNLWETVLYLYHIGPMNLAKVRTEHVFYTILKRYPYYLSLDFFGLVLFSETGSSYVPLGWSASCLCFCNAGQNFRYHTQLHLESTAGK